MMYYECIINDICYVSSISNRKEGKKMKWYQINIYLLECSNKVI